MNGTLHRRLRVFFGAAIISFICWKTVPGSSIDKVAFTSLVRGFANPPFFITGGGSHAAPWTLRTFATRNRIDSRQAPVIVSLGDDLEGFFQSSPPSPIDLAVIFNNFQRLGAKKAATAAVLAWDTPDPIGLMALDKAIARFDSLVMAAPLARGPTPEPIPPAFRNASIATGSVHGDTSLFPVVNRVPLSGIILGRENTLAGFQTLDSTPSRSFTQLIARWDDRFVFAFPLLVALQRFDFPVDGIEIRPGEYLKLSPSGPVIPLDRYGRLAVPVHPISPYAEFPAEALIDGGDDFLPKQAPEPVILRDDRSTAETATREFSKTLPSVISTISSDTALAPARDYPRIRPLFEIGFLLCIVLLITGLCGRPRFARNIAFLIAMGITVTAQCIAIGTAGIWLPGIPALAAIFAAYLLSHGASTSYSVPKLVPISPQPRPSMPPMAPTPPSLPQPEAVIDPPIEKMINKTPAVKKSAKHRKKRRR